MPEAAVDLQRSQGDLRVRLKKRGSRTVIGDLYQQGCLKARVPRQEADHAIEVVTINTAGGLTDGDELTTTIRWDADTCGVVTTQAAERIYHCRNETAQIKTALDVGNGAIACWLPQETILFDRSRLERQTTVNLGTDSVLFAVESLVFGRIAMLETVNIGQILDRLQIRQNGRLVLADALEFCADTHGSIDDQLQRTSVLGGAKCCSTIVVAGIDDGSLLDRIRELITDSPVTGGASELDAVVSIRLIADDSKTLRALILQLYGACLGARKFSEPRVWHC